MPILELRQQPTEPHRPLIQFALELGRDVVVILADGFLQKLGIVLINLTTEIMLFSFLQLPRLPVVKHVVR